MTVSKQQNFQAVQQSALPVMGKPARTDNETLFSTLEKHLDTPSRMYAAATPDTNLYFASSLIEAGDGAAKVLPPIDDKLVTSVAGSLNYQTTASPVSGITLTLAGNTYAHPTATVGQTMVGAFVRKNDGSYDCKYSTPDTQANTLALDVGSLFSSLDGLPVGFIYLECTNATGLWKTLGSSTSVIENKTGTTNTINRFGAGGGAGGGSDRTFKITSFTATGCVLKGGTAMIDDGRLLATYDGSGSASTDFAGDLTVNLNTVLSNSSLTAIGTINSASAKLLALVVDLTTLSAVATYSDYLRKVYAVQETNLRLLDQADLTLIDPRRYVLLNQIYLPITVSSWSTATGFVKPSRIHDSLTSYFPYVQRFSDTASITTATASNTLTHNLGGEPQIVLAYYYDGTNKTQLDSTYVINKTSTQVFISSMGLTFGSGQYVEVQAFYIPTLQNIAAPTSNADSPWYTSTATTTWAHGLSDIDSVRGIVVTEWNTTTGKRASLDPSALVKNWDGTNVYLDWTGLTPSSTLKYRVSLGSSPVPAVVPNGNFDSMTNKAGSGAPNFPYGATGISTGINSNPIVKKLTKQLIGSVGSAGQVRLGHQLSSKSYLASLAAANRAWLNLLTDATDGSGNATAWTNSSATFPTTGGLQNDGAASFSGTSFLKSTSSFYSIGTPGSTAAGVSFAVAFWAKPTTNWSTNQYISAAEISSSDRGWYFYADSATGTIQFGIPQSNTGGVGAAISGTPESTGWTHVCAVYDASTLTIYLYLNGKLVSQAVLTSNPYWPTTANIVIGGRQSVGSFAGTMREWTFVKNYAPTAEDVRKLASYRYDHVAGVAVGNQKWSANFYGNLTDEDGTPSTWMVDKYDSNTLFFDLSDRASTDYVELFMEDRSAAPTTVGSVTPFDTIYTANPTFPVAHGQSGVPEVMLQGEVSSGVWEQLDPQGQVNADSTNLTGSLQSFFDAGYLRVRMVARQVGPVQTGVPYATTGLAGTMAPSSAGQQRLGGLKVFEGGVASVGNYRGQEGSGTTVLTDSDKRHQVFNLTAARTVVLPTTSVLAGDEWVIENVTSGFALTIQSSDLTSIATAQGTRVTLRALQDAPTGLAHWYVAVGTLGNVRASEGAGTTTLTAADIRTQTFNLTAARTVVLPSTSILSGDEWRIENRGAFDLTIQSSNLSSLTVANGTNDDATIQKGSVILRALQDAPTSPAHWQVVDVNEMGSIVYSNTTDWSTTQTITLRYSRQNATICLGLAATISGTSISTNAVLADSTAFVAKLRPTRQHENIVGGIDNSAAAAVHRARVRTTQVDVVEGIGGTNWTTSGTKTIYPFTFTYNKG